MISDVPVGVLLSGGVDSTALLSFAVEETDKPVSTFTIGFESEQFVMRGNMRRSQQKNSVPDTMT